MANPSANIQVLQASVDEEGESEFRLLVNDKLIKYITIDGGLYDPSDMCFGPSLIGLLPPLPSGDWNTGHISLNPETGEPHFATASRVNLQGITKTWHPTQLDYLELQIGQKLRTNVYEATSPRFGSVTVLVKFARFWWEVPQLEAETMAYEWIEGHQIGPAFLGHLTEEGRVIGFIMARIPDFHHATPEDLPLCRQVLSQLHQLGIKHGDTNKHNFLIHDGRATLIDFDSASRETSADELEAELDGLGNQLNETSGLGGRFIEA